MAVARAARLLRPPGLVESSAADAELLSRYLDSADAEAFAELVRRYAGMVRGVCQRILGSTADADDAFQASFLVLVRKAATVRPRSRVGHFLYGVAYRTAVHVRSSRAARSRHHRPWTDVPAPTPATPDPDQLAALDDELAQLSEEHRTAVVLCELDGLSLKDAARRLGVPEGTLASRLARGRRKLAERLTARGLSAAVVLAAAVETATARVPVKLVRSILHSTASASEPASELAHGVLKAMLFTKLKVLSKVAAGVLLVGGLLALPLTSQAAPDPRPEPKTKAPVPTGVKSDTEVKKLYAQLGEADADRVLSAATALVSMPGETVAFLKKAVKAVSVEDKTLDTLVADLGSEADAKREAATKQLAELSTHPKVSKKLLAAMRATDDQDTRRALARIAFSSWGNQAREIVNGVEVKFSARVNAADKDLVMWTHTNTPLGTKLQAIDIPVHPEFVVGPDQSLRQLTRAVLVLEQIGTPDALAVLKDLAAGGDEVKATAEAKAALKRLGVKAK